MSVWKVTGSLNQWRAGHSATLLADGRVLVHGGTGVNQSSGIGFVSLRSAKLFDPRTGQWNPTNDSFFARLQCPEVLLHLQNHRVLAAGGATDENESVLNGTELFDPAGHWYPTGKMIQARQSHTATLLKCGPIHDRSHHRGEKPW